MLSAGTNLTGYPPPVAGHVGAIEKRTSQACVVLLYVPLLQAGFAAHKPKDVFSDVPAGHEGGAVTVTDEQIPVLHVPLMHGY
jgi:hypothetical protein